MYKQLCTQQTYQQSSCTLLVTCSPLRASQRDTSVSRLVSPWAICPEHTRTPLSVCLSFLFTLVTERNPCFHTSPTLSSTVISRNFGSFWNLLPIDHTNFSVYQTSVRSPLIKPNSMVKHYHRSLPFSLYPSCLEQSHHENIFSLLFLILNQCSSLERRKIHSEFKTRMLHVPSCFQAS